MSEVWLRWACGEAIRVLVRGFAGARFARKVVPAVPEPPGRPAPEALFVAWWRGGKLRCSARGGKLEELATRSSEGDEKHGPLLGTELDRLRVMVGVTKEGQGREGEEKVVLMKKHLRFVDKEETGLISDDEEEEGEGQEKEHKDAGVPGYVVASVSCPLSENAAEEEKPQKKEQQSRSWLRWALGIIFVGLLLYMRYHDATYDVEWEVFYSHYAVLGLKEGASLHDVKKAYHKVNVFVAVIVSFLF